MLGGLALIMTGAIVPDATSAAGPAPHVQFVVDGVANTSASWRIVPSRPSQAVDDTAGEVAAALARQGARAFEGLIVRPSASRRMSHAAAAAHCDQLEFAGLGRWELPGLGMLRSLSAAKVIEEDAFWSATKADARGGNHLVWNAKRRRIVALGGRFRGARAVCVRAPASRRDGVVLAAVEARALVPYRVTKFAPYRRLDATSKRAADSGRELTGHAEPRVELTFEDGVIKATVGRRREHLRHCVRSNARWLRPSGKLVFTIRIDSSGSVTDVRVDEDRVGSPAIVGCMRSRMRTWRFPKKVLDGPTEVTFPVAI